MKTLIVAIAVFSIVASYANDSSPMLMTDEEIIFSGAFVDVVKPKNGDILALDNQIVLRNLYKIREVIVGCSSRNDNLFFKEGSIPTVEKISSCKYLEELEKYLGLPASNRFLSTSWSLGEERHDVKYWRICRFSSEGTPLEILVVGAQVTKRAASGSWIIDDLDVKVASLVSVKNERGQ